MQGVSVFRLPVETTHNARPSGSALNIMTSDLYCHMDAKPPKRNIKDFLARIAPSSLRLVETSSTAAALGASERRHRRGNAGGKRVAVATHSHLVTIFKTTDLESERTDGPGPDQHWSQPSASSEENGEQRMRGKWGAGTQTNGCVTGYDMRTQHSRVFVL